MRDALDSHVKFGTALDSDEFRKAVTKFVASDNEFAGMCCLTHLLFVCSLTTEQSSAVLVPAGALWPIVTRVRLYSRHWELLKSGAQLVGKLRNDRPGYSHR